MKHLVRFAMLVCLTVSFSSSLWATKLVTYSYRGEARLGAFEDNGVIDLNRAYVLLLRELGKPRAEALAAALVPPNMLAFLQGEEDSLRAASEAIRFAKQQSARPGSQLMTLTPGTIVATGTPDGIGAARTPRWLRPGQTVIVEVEKLGELANPLAKE